MQALIKTNQHGLVKGRSCLIKLIEFFKEVTWCVDEGNTFDVVYLDFSKVFEKILHVKLITKRRLTRDRIKIDKIKRGIDRADRKKLFPLMEGSVTGDIDL
eukprot:g35554.t1